MTSNIAHLDDVTAIKLMNGFDRIGKWFDEPVMPYLRVVEKIAKGNKVLMRYDGSQSYEDREVSTAEKTSLGQMLLVYRYLKEQSGTGP